MAIQKEIIFKNGVKINYHKINNVILDNNNKKIKIEIFCYTEELYRKREKENLQNKARYEEIMSYILEENQKAEADRDTKKIVEISEEANILASKNKEDLDLSVVKIAVEFENVTDLSISNLYNLIKLEEMFKESKDLI